MNLLQAISFNCIALFSVPLLSCTTTETIVPQVGDPAKENTNTSKINRIVQIALEMRKSGNPEIAKIDGNTLIKITPQTTWKSKSGHFCRSYLEVVKTKNIRLSSHRRTACREHNGVWKKINKQ